MTRVRALALLFLILCSAPIALATCAPKYTLHIVTRIDAPDIPADHFIRKPKTLYRSGLLLARLEEEPNPETGLHLLLVVNGRDIWMANRMDHTGEHSLDPDPDPGFHALIVSDLESEYWKNFEFGCEVPFMEAVKAKKTATDDGFAYEHEHDGIAARLIVTKNGTPKSVRIKQDGQEMSFLYDTFEQITDADPKLFAKPEGITFTEGK